MEIVFRQECSTQTAEYIAVLLPEIARMLESAPAYGTRALVVTFNDQEIAKITVDSSEVILISNKKRKKSNGS